VTSPLDNTNSHGIRVAADRAPLREDVRRAFEKGSRGADAGIRSLVGQPRRRKRPAPAAKRAA
jgi:hypothetical protein